MQDMTTISISRTASGACLVLATFSLLAAERTADFSSDPAWEGHRNRLVPTPLPRTRQDFGYRTTRLAGGVASGEIGGRIQRSVTPAWYARVIAGKSLEDRLEVTGKFSVTRDDGGSGALFGWFHEDSRGWRTSNSLAFRIDGNGGGYWVLFEYGTRGWLTGSGATFEGRYQTTKTKPFRPDGTSHAFRLAYDPHGSDGRGEVTFVLDSKVYLLPLAPGHKADGASFNRFGLFNQQITGASLDVHFADLVLDGVPQDLTADPAWEGRGNQVEFEDRVKRPFHDFGFSSTARAGGQPGEVGGIIWRDEEPAYYADRIGLLTLDDELSASGRLAFCGAGSDSAVSIGWFDAGTKRSQRLPEPEERQRNTLGIFIEGQSQIGHRFRPAYRTSTGEGIIAPDGPIIRPDGRSHEWSIRYSPSAAGGRGRITVALDGRSRELDLEAAHRSAGARFDRFGIFNFPKGGHYVEVYVDGLRYTSGGR